MDETETKTAPLPAVTYMAELWNPGWDKLLHSEEFTYTPTSLRHDPNAKLFDAKRMYRIHIRERMQNPAHPLHRYVGKEVDFRFGGKLKT